MMDNLHGVLRTLAPKSADKARTPDHVTVFREFIAHLDRIARTPVKQSRVKTQPRVAKRRAKR
jgi:hypothetical protein